MSTAYTGNLNDRLSCRELPGGRGEGMGEGGPQVSKVAFLIKTFFKSLYKFCVASSDVQVVPPHSRSLSTFRCTATALWQRNDIVSPNLQVQKGRCEHAAVIMPKRRLR